MESKKYPDATYIGKIRNLAKINFAKDGTYPVETTGKMTIHGIPQKLSFGGTVQVKGKEIILTSQLLVTPADYDINAPAVSLKTSTEILREIEIKMNSILVTK